MHCFRCGAAVTAGSRFCATCGGQVSDPAAATIAVATEMRAPLLEQLRRALAPEYEVERELGRGGMAIVYRATETALGRPVALKVLPPDLAHTEGLSERFKREAKLTAALDHPHIMPIYRVGQADGLAYIAMKLVEGRSIDQILDAQGPLPLPVILYVLRAATAALAFAHERGVIHRDVKGGNILIDRDGRVLVTDFGIARAVEQAAVTGTSTVVGTPYFMSPEQCSGKPVGPQSDQYALGVVTFQMLTGRVPFDADSLPAIMHHHFFTPAPNVGEVRRDVPAPLAALVRRALAKKPEERWSGTGEMLAAVHAIPFTEADRAEGEALLRELARGGDAPPLPPGTVAPARPLPPPGGSELREVARALAARAKARAAGLGRGPVMALVALALLLVIVLGATIVRRSGPSGAIRRGTELYVRGERARAREIFREVARDHPGLAPPHIYLGRIAREDGDLALARRELQAAIELAPRSATAQREMGSLLLSTGRYELARRFYARALELDPDDRTTAGYLGCALVRLGRVHEGQQMMQRAGSGPWTACR